MTVIPITAAHGLRRVRGASPTQGVARAVAVDRANLAVTPEHASAPSVESDAGREADMSQAVLPTAPRQTSPKARAVMFRLDRDLRAIGLGRLQVVTGATDEDDHRYLNGLVTLLIKGRQIDILRALCKREITLQHLRDADSLGRLTRVLDDARAQQMESAGERTSVDPLDQPLWSTVFDTVLPAMRPAHKRAGHTKLSPDTLRRYRTSWNALRVRMEPLFGSDATLRQLAEVDFDDLYETWGKSAADWNHLRRAVSAVLSSYLGTVHHPFRIEVMQEIAMAEEVERIPDVSPEQFKQVLAAMPEHAQKCIMVLLLTAMRVGEYLRTRPEHLKHHQHLIQVPGSKTTASKAAISIDPRYWQWIVAGVPSPLQYGWMRKYWLRACAEVGLRDVRLQDIRHLAGQWSTDRGAPEKSVQALLRHTNGLMTRRYTKTGSSASAARGVADALSESLR